MTARVLLILAALGALQTPQTFRTITDAVVVDVNVRSGGRAVTGLTPADFVLTDNGVRQRVESVEAAAVSLDVSLVVDLSGNPRRPRGPHADPARAAAALESEMREVTKILRPTDRVRLLAIDRYVRQVWPFLPVTELPAIQGLEIDGLAAVYEGLAAALLHPVEPARRHVVVIRTKGVDTISSISAQALGAIAARSDALLNVVIMETALLQDQAIASFQCVPLGFCMPTNRSWLPVERRLVGQVPTAVSGPQTPGLLLDGIALKAGVDATGGGWHQTMLLTEPTLTGTFREAFDDVRSSYILRYTPQGVTRGGWHTIDVTVPKAKGASERARKGYGIDDTAPEPAPRPASAVPSTLADIAAAYERGAYQNAATGLRQAESPERLIRDFNAVGNPWPATPRREAAFVVDLAEAAIFAEAPAARKSGEEQLNRTARLVRHPLGPGEFERQWYVAVLAMLQGAIRPEVARSFVDRALARFPGDPRFVLARAIVSDQRLMSGAAKPAAPYEETVKAYEEAIAHPEVATEARIRLGLRLHLQGRHAVALEHLTLAASGARADPTLGYLRQLFLGHVYAALNRRGDALASYRAALEIVPPGQAARVALMSQLLLGGGRPDAVMHADLVQTEQSPVYDPWWLYWQGQYRDYSQAMARLREMAQPPK